MKIQFKKLKEDAQIPTRAKEGDAGFDFYALNEFSLYPGERVAADTHIACAIPFGYVGLIKSRSSVSKRGIDALAGVIDSGYRGEVKILLTNNKSYRVLIKKGDRLAQMVVIPALLDSEEVDELPESFDGRGAGGFGLTGA